MRRHPHWQIATWRDGLVVEIREYLDGAAAEQAAGIQDNETQRDFREP